jgi:hypothetical protein
VTGPSTGRETGPGGGAAGEQPLGGLAAEAARVLTELAERTRQVRPEAVQQAVRAAGEFAVAVRDVLAPAPPGGAAGAAGTTPRDNPAGGVGGPGPLPPLQHIDVGD